MLFGIQIHGVLVSSAQCPLTEGKHEHGGVGALEVHTGTSPSRRPMARAAPGAPQKKYWCCGLLKCDPSDPGWPLAPACAWKGNWSNGRVTYTCHKKLTHFIAYQQNLTYVSENGGSGGSDQDRHD